MYAPSSVLAGRDSILVIFTPYFLNSAKTSQRLPARLPSIWQIIRALSGLFAAFAAFFRFISKKRVQLLGLSSIFSAIMLSEFNSPPRFVQIAAMPDYLPSAAIFAAFAVLATFTISLRGKFFVR